MQSAISVVTPAEDISLLTLYEAKLALNMTTTTTQVQDDQIELMIRWASSEIATTCNRVFAKETVVETFRELDNYRIFLSRYPVSNIESVDDNGTLLTEDDYELDTGTGKLTRLTGTWGNPVTVKYTGGYDLPFEAPVALQQAALLMTREAYNATVRGDATVRMVSHKESRIIYFDPNARTTAAGASATSGGGSPARRAVNDLLRHYMRFEV